MIQFINRKETGLLNIAFFLTTNLALILYGMAIGSYIYN